MNTLSSACKTAKDLSNYLIEKGESHNCYKCYATLERIVGIRDKKKLYLGNGKNWNDTVDREAFNSDVEFSYFAKCFSFSREESVAMWMLYGGIDKKGGMIDFTQKGIKSILKAPEITVGRFADKVFQPIKKLHREEFEIYVTDIVYYKKQNNGYFIKRSDETCHSLSEKIFSKLQNCKKSYAWQYENECRLIVKIKKELLDSNCEAIEIDLSNMELGKSLDHIYRSPNYPTSEIFNSNPSNIEKTVDWNLVPS